MIKKRKEENAQKKVQGHGNESKKSMVTLKGVKKVMLAQKPIFLVNLPPPSKTLTLDVP